MLEMKAATVFIGALQLFGMYYVCSNRKGCAVELLHMPCLAAELISRYCTVLERPSTAVTDFAGLLGRMQHLPRAKGSAAPMRTPLFTAAEPALAPESARTQGEREKQGRLKKA